MPFGLPAALSWALLAFTIELDNEFEHRMPNRTADRPDSRGVWLASMAMWSNFVRLVPPDGVPLSSVEANARITNLGGLQRWGYVDVSAGTVRLKPGGRRARQVWTPLAGEIEARWRDRLGHAAVDELREALSSVADPALPWYLPVVGYADGMRSDHARGVGGPGAAGDRDLAALLSQVLLAFTFEYEAQSRLSLPMAEDVLRVLDGDGVRVRDLPALSGVSKEGLAAATGFLDRHGYAVTEPDPSGRGKLVRLTRKGVTAQVEHGTLLEAVERRWAARLGKDLDRLRDALITDDRLSLGLTPYPDGWRARNPYRTRTLATLADPVATLPRYPMVLHRGGYPDGS